MSNSSQDNSMPTYNVNDNDKAIQSNFIPTNEVASMSAPTLPPHALSDKTTSKASDNSTPTPTVDAATTRERQKVSDLSLHNDNDYQSMKRAIDTFNAKMDVYMDYQANEMAAHTIKLNSMKDKLNTLDVLHHEIDRLASRQNMVEQSLQVIRDAILGSQSINNKLDRLELLMRQTNVRIDDFMAKQWKWTTTPANDDTKRKPNVEEDPMPGNSEQCEMKIEQLIAFLNSFAELNRLENSGEIHITLYKSSSLITLINTKILHF